MKTKRDLIHEHIEEWTDLRLSSIEHFFKTGKASGGFLIALEKMMQSYTDQETSSLREQLKEKEEEIANWKLEAHGYLNNLNNLKAEVEPLIEAATLKLESQSKLIESLAEAAKKALTEYNNYKNKQNGKETKD